MAERIFPLAKPKCLHDAIYATARRTGTTLQEHMRFEHETETFSKLIQIIRHTADDHIDLTLPYRRQHADDLEKIRQDVLDQCPTLEDMYVDAWPISSYLQVALKKHHPVKGLSSSTTSSRKSPRQGSSKHLPGSSKASRIRSSSSISASRRFARGKSTSTQFVRRSTRMTRKARVGADDAAQDNAARALAEEMAVDSEGNSEEGTSTEDEWTDASPTSPPTESVDSVDHDTGYLCSWSGSISTLSDDSEDSDEKPLITRLGSPSTLSTESAPGDAHARLEEDSCSPDVSGPTNHTPRRENSTVSSPTPSDDAPSIRKSGTPIDELASTSEPPPSPAPTIQGMFLTRGLSPFDAERITIVLASLGVVDETYRDMLSRTLPCAREAWLSRLEDQAWVVIREVDAIVTHVCDA